MVAIVSQSFYTCQTLFAKAKKIPGGKPGDQGPTEEKKMNKDNLAHHVKVKVIL